MKRLVIASLIGAFVGSALTVGLFVPLLIHQRGEKFQEGLVHGRTDGASDVAHALLSEFGEYHEKDGIPSKDLMSLKNWSIRVIEEQGVKTVRVQ